MQSLMSYRSPINYENDTKHGIVKLSRHIHLMKSIEKKNRREGFLGFLGGVWASKGGFNLN